MSVNIAVIALLKPSQVKYKLTPLVNSDHVNSILLFRKHKLDSQDLKVKQFVLPNILTYKLFYWTLTPFYIANRLRKYDIDLLLTYRLMPHACFTWVVSKLLKKPFIYSQIDLDVETMHRHQLGKHLVNFVLRDAAQINVPGSRSQLYWRSIYKTKINILHSTIDTNEFVPLPVSKEYDLIYVGEFSALKRVLLLASVVKEMVNKGKDLKMAMIGYGEELGSLKKYINANGLDHNIKILGKRAVDSDILNRARIFTMASKREGLPCALMEAMSCSLLCITTDVGNISDAIIDGKTGYFYRSLDPSQMADRLLWMLEEYENLEPVRVSAREQIVTNHSYESATKKWDRILSNL